MVTAAVLHHWMTGWTPAPAAVGAGGVGDRILAGRPQRRVQVLPELDMETLRLFIEYLKIKTGWK